MSQCPGKSEKLTPTNASASQSLTGKAYWRSLEDYAGTPEFRKWAEKEFPQFATELGQSYASDGPSRRRFLQIMGASIALAGLTGITGCRRNEDKIRAYNKKPVDVILGKPTYYATTFVLAGVPMGLLVETHEGRPTKIEGNPSHPNSLGATNAFAQASVLDLYDPDRSRTYLHQGQAVAKEDFLAALDKLSGEFKANSGKGLAILSEDYASPAMDLIREHISKTMPAAVFHVYEPADMGSALRRPYDLDKADVILSLDCDFLGLEDYGIRHKRAFANRRRVQKPGDEMNRLYAVEPHWTVTGAGADHRLRLPASRVRAYVAALARELGVTPSSEHEPLADLSPTWIKEVAADLLKHKGRALILAGNRQPADVHDLVAKINRTLGSEPVDRIQTSSLAELSQQIKANQINTLLILGGNPAFNAPGDLLFASLLKQIPTTIRLGLHEDETSAQCTWHVPAAHYLESWGDAITADGHLSPIQPMIDPLFGGLSPLELLARVGGYETTDPYEIVRRSFKRLAGDDLAETNWRQYLHEGVYSLRFPLLWERVRVRALDGESAARASHSPHPHPLPGERVLLFASASNLEICFSLDESIFDGRFANNGWLQECPDPITKLTWDNAAILSPKTAAHFNLKQGDVVRIELNNRTVEAPIFILPGHADWSITLPLGYGRTQGGPLAAGTGFNAYALRTSDAMGFALGAKITPTGKTYPLATTQEHWSVAEHHLGIGDEVANERALIREGTLEEFEKNPAFAKEMGEHAPIKLNIYTSPKLEGANQWGMAIDLNTCLGCNACVVACQAENNIPIVGKNEVIRGREMHWIRLDRYFSGEPDADVETNLQPMMCQHCENAPCEPVCPVNATVHSPEGLNEMVYNRCIGTRYCSNNCPYKVRRFNFFDYNKGTIRESGHQPFDGNPEPDPRKSFSQPQLLQPPMQEMLKMQKNPNVTVRMRGVMEKCTYCVQRIEAAKIQTQSAIGQGPANSIIDGQPAVKVPDGAIQTACQQSCPTQAITFGDVRDPSSQVHQLQQSPRSYAVLEHLNVRPRTSYLARIRNLNPRMEVRS